MHTEKLKHCILIYWIWLYWFLSWTKSSCEYEARNFLRRFLLSLWCAPTTSLYWRILNRMSHYISVQIIPFEFFSSVLLVSPLATLHYLTQKTLNTFFRYPLQSNSCLWSVKSPCYNEQEIFDLCSLRLPFLSPSRPFCFL